MKLGRSADPSVIGIDEAGRGAWAGPIVGAAVLFKDKIRIPKDILIRDSKKLSPSQHMSAARFIIAHAHYSMASVSSVNIDRNGIQNANKLIFMRSVEKLLLKIGASERNYRELRILADGRRICDFDLQNEFVIRGDGKHLSIAAASILAKVARDYIMRRIGQRIPAYDFGRHKGYGTRIHHEALIRSGVSEVHRLSYAPIRLIHEHFSKDA